MTMKLVVNGTLIEEGSPVKVFRAFVGCLQTRLPGEVYDCKIYYLAKSGSWLLDSGVVVR